ncbi:MAG: hypothetical protein HY775_01485 [Acidobacteria bacterium]|nr:hypothetical protein [Acidobacteriota bacterium]
MRACQRALIRAVPALLMAPILILPAPALAHTNVFIAGYQIVPGSCANALGAVPTQCVDNGPATDGMFIFFNADPVTHTLAITAGPADTVGIQLATVATGETVDACHKLPKGNYTYGDPAFPSMRARFRVTADPHMC